MECDLSRYHRLDLLDLYRGRLAWRKVLVFATHLPRESSLVTAVVGEPAEWSVTDHLLAHVVDGINHLLYAYIAAHSKSKPAAPKPFPRPVARSSNNVREPLSTPNDIHAFMTTLNGG